MTVVIRNAGPGEPCEVLTTCSKCGKYYWEDVDHAYEVIHNCGEDLVCIYCDEDADVPAIVMPPPYFQELDL